jgi:hypothetical protein
MKSQRQRARQNLLMAAVNVALERGLIPLDGQPPALALFEFEIMGEPALASVRDGRYGELKVQVMVRPNDRGRKFAHVIVTSERVATRVTELGLTGAKFAPCLTAERRFLAWPTTKRPGRAGVER